jgi:hypothetical protein
VFRPGVLPRVDAATQNIYAVINAATGNASDRSGCYQLAANERLGGG